MTRYPDVKRKLPSIVDCYGFPCRSRELIIEKDPDYLIEELEERSIIDTSNNKFSALKPIVDLVENKNQGLIEEFRSLIQASDISNTSTSMEGRMGINSGFWTVSTNIMIS